MYEGRENAKAPARQSPPGAWPTRRELSMDEVQGTTMTPAEIRADWRAIRVRHELAQRNAAMADQVLAAARELRTALQGLDRVLEQVAKEQRA